MANRKVMVWALVLAVLGAVSAVVWRNQVRHRDRGAAAAEARARAKDKKTQGGEAGDDAPEKPAPAPQKAKETALSQAGREFLAEQAFIAGLRDVFVWRGGQPRSPETMQALLEKLSTLPCDDLPAERKSAWQSLLGAWNAQGHPAQPSSFQDRQAAETLNAMFKAHGDGDISL